MILQAVHAGFEYFQREAGYTRTGSHTKRVSGRDPGQWHEADLAVAHWLQHTSRDSDIRLLSSRRESITAALRARAAQFETTPRQRPSQVP